MDRSLYFLFNSKLVAIPNTSGEFGYGGNTAVSSLISDDKYQINYRGQQFSNGIYKPHNNIPQDINKESDKNRNGLVNIIKESQKYPLMSLKPQDFVYLKDFTKYPLNRCVVLRRFENPIDDNLFYAARPDRPLNKKIATIVGWIKPEDESFFSISFHENWESEDRNIAQILKEALVFDSIGSIGAGGAIGGIGGAAGGIVGKITGTIQKFTPFTEYVNYKLLEKFGVLGGSLFDILGNPNLISETRRRAISHDRLAKPFEFNLNFEFETEYEYRYINNIDPSTVMLDILSNIIRMGVTEERYFLSSYAGGKISEILKRIRQGEMIKLIKDLIFRLSEVLSKIIKDFSENIDKLINQPSQSSNPTSNQQQPETTESVVKQITGDITGFINEFAASIIAKYRIELAASIAWMSGASTGIWHLTIGNPINPFVSIGNLILDDVKIEFGNELAFDDTPSRIKVSFQLSPARTRGAQMLEQIFNRGQGRVYYKSANNNPGIVQKSNSLAKIDGNISKKGISGGVGDTIDADLRDLEIANQIQGAEAEAKAVKGID